MISRLVVVVSRFVVVSSVVGLERFVVVRLFVFGLVVGVGVGVFGFGVGFGVFVV